MSLIVSEVVWGKMILKINNYLKEKGLCLLIFDAYCPIEFKKYFGIIIRKKVEKKL